MTNFFVQNIHDEIEIVAEKEWRKCLKESPVFIIREIEKIRIKSAKSSSAIRKTTNCGKRCKEEGYLSADDVFVANIEIIFFVKGKCKAPMKREIRLMEVDINKVNCDITFVKCSCRTGETGYLNHIMALSFEIAGYSLHN